MRAKFKGILFDYKNIFWMIVFGIHGSKYLEIPTLDLFRLPENYKEYAKYVGNGVWSLKFLKYAQIGNYIYYKMIKYE
jgi:hypothetical protein